MGTYYDRYINPNFEALYLWLLSLDTNGCLDANNCGSDIGYKEWTLNQDAVKIYPNSATTYINL